jgi:phosphate transport system permease protein
MPAEFSSLGQKGALWQPNRRRSKQIEWVVRSICFVFAAISILTTLGIVLTLIFETFEFFHDPFFRQSLWVEQLPSLLPNASAAQLETIADRVMDADPEALNTLAQDLDIRIPGQVAGFFYALRQFLTDTRWTPLFQNADFGIFVLISATLLTSTIAIAVAVPIGLLIAIFLSEYASPNTRQVLKPILEILAGIPSVVFGYFALLTVTPFLQELD